MFQKNLSTCHSSMSFVILRSIIQIFAKIQVSRIEVILPPLHLVGTTSQRSKSESNILNVT